MIINKIDLASYVEFDRDRCLDNAKRINPEIETLELSSKTGEGFEDWRNWIERRGAEIRESAGRAALTPHDLLF